MQGDVLMAAAFYWFLFVWLLAIVAVIILTYSLITGDHTWIEFVFVD